MVHAHADGTIEVHDFLLTDGRGSIRLDEGLVRDKFVDVELLLEHIAVNPLVRLAAPTQTLEGDLSGRVQVKGALTEPSGVVALTLSSVAVQGYQFRQAEFESRLTAPWFEITKIAIRMPNADHDIVGRGLVPMHVAIPTQPNLPVNLKLEAPHLPPDLLTAFVPGLVIDRGGQAAVAVTVSGRYPKLTVNGDLTADFPHMAFAKAGLDLRSFRADIHSEGKTIDIRYLGGQTPKGPLRISGTSTLPDLDFTIEGQDVVLKIPKQLDAEMNLALRVGGSLNGPDLRGDIQIKEATYTRQKKTKKQKEEEEKAAEEAKKNKTVETEEKDNAAWEGTTMDVHAVWPRNVWYRDGVSKIETSGDLRIQKDDGTTQPYMTGRIAIVRGSYAAVGREFIMDSGDIVFTGPPGINPILNIRAKWSSGGVDVFLDVKGPLSELERPRFSSNPTMPEPDVLATLVYGRPLSEVGANQTGGGTTKNQQAAALASSVVGGYLTKELRETGLDLGLDVVRVDPTTQGSRLTVGRYVGEKLFLSYGQPLRGEATRVFNADYYISKRWTLEGQTGSAQDSFLDFQFRYPLNEPDYPKTPPPSPPMRTSQTAGSVSAVQ
jgi:autotransporter translocation and assembly factor TamB